MNSRIRYAEPVERAAVRSLLAASALPVDDLQTAPLQIWVACDGNQIIGAVGLERYGSTGLLRSLAVAPSHQRRGLGQQLVASLEIESRTGGVRRLVLLTQTAEWYFHRLGYAVVDRGEVPDEVKQSAEFRSLCPASAVCMTKSLRSAPSVND